MTTSAEPSTPSGSAAAPQRRRQITSYKSTTSSPATDRRNCDGRSSFRPTTINSAIDNGGITHKPRRFDQLKRLRRRADPSRIRRHDALGRQAPKHRINPPGRQLGATVKPPGHHGHESANYVLDGKFAREDVGGFFVNSRGKLVAHQIGEYLANGTKGNGTAAAANQRPVEVNMVAAMLEHGQAEAQASVPDISWHRQSILLPIHEQPAQIVE